MTEQTKVGIVGAGGRMGQEIARAVNAHPDTIVASGLDRAESPAFGQDIGVLAGFGKSGVHITDDVNEMMRAADVIVDLSLPVATLGILNAAVENRRPLCCGTTGVGHDVLKKFEEAAAQIPVLYASNLSLGVAVLSDLVEQASRILDTGFDIEVVEMHHRNKVDAPSGTALTLAESAARGRGLTLEDVIRNGREGHTGVRSDDEIGMHAVRGGGVFGDHTVILASRNERIELSHKAASRGLFAEGAVKAAIFLAKQTSGQYTMKDVLLGR